MRYTIVILISTTPNWLWLSRRKRDGYFENAIRAIINKYKDSVSVHMFDSEAFNSRHTDFLLIETDDLTQYYYFWEAIRDSKVYSAPFLFNEIVVCKEEGYKDFEKTTE